MKKNKLMKGMMGGALGLTATGLTIGAGASAVTAAGGNASGLNAFSSMMPVTGTVMGGGIALQALGGLQPNQRKRRKR